MHKFQKVTLLIAPLLLLAACSTDGGVNPMTSSAQSSSASIPEIGGSNGSKPTISAPSGDAPKNLEKKDIFV